MQTRRKSEEIAKQKLIEEILQIRQEIGVCDQEIIQANEKIVRIN